MIDAPKASGIAAKFKATRIVIILAATFIALRLPFGVLYYSNIVSFLAIAGIVQGFASLLLNVDLVLFVILYSLWVYAFHKELAGMDASYRVTPAKALARFLIPGYNIWGIWKIHSGYANLLKADPNQNRVLQGSRMMQILPLLYICLIGGYILGRLANIKGIGETIPSLIDVMGSLFYIAAFVILLQMITIMQPTILEKMNNK